jgi:hypothetical protein
MIVLKNGMRVKIEKDEIEEAQNKKGTTIMTASGVPIKVSPSGAITVEHKQPAKKMTPAPAKPAPKITPAAQKPNGPAKLNAAPTTAKKTTPAAGAPKKLGAPSVRSNAPRKL